MADKLVTQQEMASRIGECYLPDRMIGLVMPWVPDDLQGWLRLLAVKSWREMGKIHDGGPGPDEDFSLRDVLDAPYDIRITEWNQ